ncbi:MAG: phosphoglycerate dehydrogenase [Proteobacteria bacterium]|nr:phosphoglycerate dehydrogenase [Pseudomonadota bacterium]
MSETLIKVATRSFSAHPVLRDELIAGFPRAAFNEEGIGFAGDALVDYLSGAEGAIIGLESMTDDVLAALPDLKIISKFGVGLDSIDQEACARRGVKIGWTPGLNKRGVAEMAVCFMIGLARNIFRAHQQLIDGNWAKNGGRLLQGCTVGIIGVGHIGKELVQLLAPFGCKILVNDIVDQSAFYREHGLTEASKAEIYAKADIISVHVPLDDNTRGFINADVFSAMKSDAYFINTARGGLVVQDDLKLALINGEIAGAAIDVFDSEPCDDLEFIRLPNLMSTPHTAGNADESVLAMGRSSINHLSNFFS